MQRPKWGFEWRRLTMTQPRGYENENEKQYGTMGVDGSDEWEWA